MNSIQTVGLEEIDKVFQLLGYSEDDISAAIATSMLDQYRIIR